METEKEETKMKKILLSKGFDFKNITRSEISHVIKHDFNKNEDCCIKYYILYNKKEYFVGRIFFTSFFTFHHSFVANLIAKRIKKIVENA